MIVLQSAVIISAVALGVSVVSALFSCLIWRWNTVDDELERQKKISHRIEDFSATLNYGRPLSQSSGGVVTNPTEILAQNTEEEYTVNIGKVILSESSGFKYFVRKAIFGSFEGRTELNILFSKYLPMGHRTRALPDNIDHMAHMNLLDYDILEDWSCIYNESGIIELHFGTADPDKLEQSLEDWLVDLEEILLSK